VRRVFALLALGACGDGVGTSPDARDVDARTADAFVAPGFANPLVIPATSARISNPFTVLADGNVAVLGTIDLAGALGTVGAMPAFVYEQQPFGDFVLYQGFAVTADRWDVFWVYCNGDALTGVYDQSIGGQPLVYRAGAGTCAATPSPSSGTVAFPSVTLPVPQPVPGYTVDGPDIHLDDGYGTITLDGAALPAIVWSTVDCRTECGSPGWFELHLLLWDRTAQRAIFTIGYLLDGDTSSISLQYSRALPDLTDPIAGRSLAATWAATARLSPTPRAEGVPRFAVPPRAPTTYSGD